MRGDSRAVSAAEDAVAFSIHRAGNRGSARHLELVLAQARVVDQLRSDQRRAFVGEILRLELVAETRHGERRIGDSSRPRTPAGKNLQPPADGARNRHDGCHRRPGLDVLGCCGIDEP